MFTNSIDSRAILLHRERTTNAIEVTSHDVIETETGYTLGAGQLFGPEQKAELSGILSNERKSESLTLIDPRVIAQTSFAIVWWMPATKRTIKQNHSEGGDHKTQQFTIKTPNTIGVMCRGRLYVASYKGAAHPPESDTALYRPPLSNLTSATTFCMGNIRIPSEIDAAHIDTWTDAIWHSTNTHLGKPPLKGANSVSAFVEILKSIDNTNRFPSNKLIPLDATLSEFLRTLEMKG